MTTHTHCLDCGLLRCRRVASVHSFCFNKGYKPPLPPNGSVPVDLVINLGDSTTRPCPTTPQQVQQLYADLETISQQVRVVSIIPPSQQPIIDRIVWQPFNPSLCNVAQQVRELCNLQWGLEGGGSSAGVWPDMALHCHGTTLHAMLCPAVLLCCSTARCGRIMPLSQECWQT